MEVLVIGGGASGMMAAISAASMGANVTIYEHNDVLGKKLSRTGNGRCNLGNTYLGLDCYHSVDADLLNEYFTQFDESDTIRTFKSLGLIIKDENGYPLYELADSFDNTICWVEYTREKACYYAYQAENEKMIKICELSDSERVSDEADYCGIYQNNYIYMKRDSVKNCIDIISYDMDKEYMQVMYSCDYISNLNYSLSVKGNYLSVLLGKKY